MEDEYKYLGLHVTKDEGINVKVRSRMNEVGKVWEGMKRVFRCRSLGRDAKINLFEGVRLLTAMCRA